jgi:hypothetical protein
VTIGFLNRCVFTAASAGTGDFAYSSAVTGYLSPSAAGAVDGVQYHYFAQSDDLSQWEVGTGVWTAAGTILDRVPVKSSNANALVAFTSAPKVYMGGPLAADVVTPDSVRNKLTADTSLYVRTPPVSVAVSNATPAVCSWTGHGLSIGSAVIFSRRPQRRVVEVTIASPCVATCRDADRYGNTGLVVPHGFSAGQPILFRSRGSLPTGITKSHHDLLRHCRRLDGHGISILRHARRRRSQHVRHADPRKRREPWGKHAVSAVGAWRVPAFRRARFDGAGRSRARKSPLRYRRRFRRGQLPVFDDA